MNKYIRFVDENSELYKLVTTYQVHTIVPHSKDLSKDQKNEIMQQRDNLLCKVKNYIDENLNPKK